MTRTAQDFRATGRVERATLGPLIAPNRRMANNHVSLLVLGLGNLLARDDGLGVAALGLLARRWRAPEGVRLLDGGTRGAALQPWIAAADALIVVDAVRIEEPSGTLVRLEGADEVCQFLAERVGDVPVPRTLVLLGIVPQDTELGLDRSKPVETALPALVDLIVAEASTMGFRFAPLPDRSVMATTSLQEMR